jgi:hypothetical protein
MFANSVSHQKLMSMNDKMRQRLLPLCQEWKSGKNVFRIFRFSSHSAYVGTYFVPRCDDIKSSDTLLLRLIEESFH